MDLKPENIGNWSDSRLGDHGLKGLWSGRSGVVR